MAEVTIRIRPNGPLLVEGPFRLIDSAGNEFPLDPAKANHAFCRCGQSGRKPFCDGMHKGCSFISDERSPATP